MPKFLKIDELIDAITSFLKVKLELVKLDLIERVSKVVAAGIVFVFVFAIFLFFLAFLSFFIAEVLNNALSSTFWGYGIVAGIYLILIIILFYLLKSGKIQAFIENMVIESVDTSDDN